MADEARWRRSPLLAMVAGALGIPGVTDAIEHFLEPTFADSRYAEDKPSDSAEWIGLAAAGSSSIAGIAARLPRLHAPAAGSACSCASASRGCTASCVNKWYFDELFDAVFVARMSRRRRTSAGA